ncbi:hypothetical protein AAG906_007934 [Vitis piasezkii]|uniref:SBP-type domain-containing protein n=2 Tax=Vitis vinifera TaxID=29760 RepID=A0ABY9DCL3_VITVI|nr:squamosa promoter-binding-like protein 7 isoform X1 [Vitis vinifera]WKA05410.1 hypothetical protein VitviT2T_023380 [Vitis vinifera]|eukprot:XP_010661347.1 PREDICTED: squamosa promoter-binding-like protein 7 isoform X1 [Vitis vinifera]
MENGGNSFNGNRGQNGNSGSHLAWDVRDLGASRFDWNCTGNSFNDDAATATATDAPTQPEAGVGHALMFPHQATADVHHNQYYHQHNHHHHHQQSLYGGDGSHLHPDPHLMCLKLGKRHYFEDSTPGISTDKRGRPYYSGGSSQSSATAVSVVGSPATVPRCQVEGCHVALVNAKDYHRRHKVCEMHSKAPKVVVLGLEQRFCQQCSRFHAVSEFDDSKRSCRRRLAGHNERRRKSSHDSVARNPSQAANKLMTGRFAYLSSPTGRALSLLSSKSDSWVSSAELSLRSSAALRELIAENRAAILARQLILDRDWHWHHHGMEDSGGEQPGSDSLMPHQHQMFPGSRSWERFHEANGHVTLDLMQAPSSAFGLLSVREKSKEEEEECSELWNSLEGTHVV